MKKILSIAAIVIMAFAFISCGGSDSKFVGKWELTKASYSGIEMTAADMGMEGVTMDVKSNGKVTLDFDGDSSKGEWTEKDGKLVIEESGEKITAELQDDFLVMEYSGVQMFFEKK